MLRPLLQQDDQRLILRETEWEKSIEGRSGVLALQKLGLDWIWCFHKAVSLGCNLL